ncbi:MAG: transporter substrate-binding domain-containing protein [Cyclobacteriaceae bacterium]
MNRKLSSNLLSLLVISILFSQIIFGCTTPGNSNRKLSPETEPEEVIADVDFQTIQERGYITAIIDNSSTGLFIYKGNIMGYEYDLLKEFAKSQNLELKIDITPSISEAFDKLNSGEGDILAYNLTVTKERKKRIAFTHYHNLVKMVLVQRKPDNWRDMKLHEIEATLIRNPVELIGKEVIVRNSSSYLSRLQNLSDEIGGDIIIVQDEPDVETEAIIRKVAEGEIDYTVADEDVALVNSTYYRNIDVRTAVSFPTQIAWGARKNDPVLLDSLNNWILAMRKTPEYYTIYNKYFRSRKASLRRSKSEFFSIGGEKLSPYDSLIKEAAGELGWDWRLLAAQIFKESEFDATAKSWAGAVGLLQLLPSTAEEYGIKDLKNPSQNLKAGVQHLQWLENYFLDVVADEEERVKFVLAAYNVGHGHVMDAIRLAEKNGDQPDKWEIIEHYLLKKSNPKYYNDPVVVYGYCRGIEPVTYVSRILSMYEKYTAVFSEKGEVNGNI